MDEEHKRNLPVPFFSQREVNYIWEQYSQSTNMPTGTRITMAWQSCNITSLAMILHYFGITEDSPDVMLDKFYTTVFQGHSYDFRHELFNPNINEGKGPDRLELASNLKNFVQQVYNVREDYIRTEKLTLNGIKEEIKSGFPVWISNGLLSSNEQRGHIAVIRGFTGDDDIILNDPYGDPLDNQGKIKTTGIQGHYDNIQGGSQTSGRGNGDNIVLHKDKFNDVFSSPAHQSLVIRYPHLWSFPVRDGSSNAPWCFSRQCDTEEELDEFREKQLEEMLKKETLAQGCYPISGNGRWHDGIHIEKARGTPIYAVGPGRLIAVRSVETKLVQDQRRASRTYLPSTCFAFCRHPVTIDGLQSAFYSLYMHLKPLSEIQQRINDRFSFGVPFEAGDWLDQILKHIFGRKATIRPGGEGSLTGEIADDTPRVYRKNALNNSGEELKTRGILYLCPEIEGIKKSLSEININENIDGIYNNLNNLDNYKFTSNGSVYYRIFYNKNEFANSNQLTNRMHWEDRYVKSNNIRLLNMNKEEFVYWRKKLSQLINGEVVGFNDEDSNIRTRSPGSTDYNVDYHIEVTNRIKLGVFGDNEKDMLHFGIFSDDTLINDPAFPVIVDSDKDKYFDRHHVVGKLIDAGVFTSKNFSNYYLSRKMISQEAYHNFYKRKDGKILLNVICRHLNSYAIQDENDWVEMMKNGTGTFDYNEEYIKHQFLFIK